MLIPRMLLTSLIQSLNICCICSDTATYIQEQKHVILLLLLGLANYSFLRYQLNNVRKVWSSIMISLFVYRLTITNFTVVSKESWLITV